MKRELLIIFTRNPELGKCKTRLAASIGDVAALEVYKLLVEHTHTITRNLQVTKEIHYSEAIQEHDRWDSTSYIKKQQTGDNLGQRMENAFKRGFEHGFQQIIIIGCDLYDLTQKDLEKAFAALQTNDIVIGPAEDGGYYLLGMKSLHPQVFKNKAWGTNTVLKDTLSDLKERTILQLEERNDIDYYDDMKGIEAFQKFLVV